MVNVFVALAPTVGSGQAPPTLVLLHPAAPFANVGFHQEADRELDVAYCRAHGIPVVRRVVGGGAILDGPWEQDYMVIVPDGAPGTTGTVAQFYDRYLDPVRSALGALGVEAERSGINDLAVEGRKVSANGAVTLDGSWVLAGDVLLDLDVAAMSRVLRVPDEKFRGKLVRSMDAWLTSLRTLLPRAPSRVELSDLLRDAFARSFDVELLAGSLTASESRALAELRTQRAGDAWTFQKDRAHPDLAAAPPEGRAVKISNEAILARADLKAGKLVRVTLLHRRGRVEEIQFSGDFFTRPFDGHLAELERALSGAPIGPEELRARIGEWLRQREVTLVGATPTDLARAVVQAASLAPTFS